MNLKGRRIHIAGSVSPDAAETKLSQVHVLVKRLTQTLAIEGASFIISFGREPRIKNSEDGPAIIFDWTIAEELHRLLEEGRIEASGPNGRLITAVATSKTDAQIPAERRGIYEDLRNSDAISMEYIEPGWSGGAFRRQRLAQLGDILVGISGGEGVEHLAIEYSARGKPVIPLDIDMGSSQHDGSGGAARLFRQALARPGDFFRVVDGHSSADLLDRTRTRNDSTDVSKTVSCLMNLLLALAPPQVFYVRLLNDSLPEYPSIEHFFRDTMDLLVRELGYEPFQMGVGKNEFAWMNEAIFSALHHSSVVVADLTGLRQNWFMELGYALGNKQRVIVTARHDTHFPFDSFALEAFLWKEPEDLMQRMNGLRAHWKRNIDMPALVRPREAR